MYFFDVVEALELLPGMCVGLPSTVYYQHRLSLEPQETKGWFLVTKALSLPVGEALAFCTLPGAPFRTGLKSWFPAGEEAETCQGSGIYLAVEPTVLPVSTQVQLTPEKALAWQFYLQEIASEVWKVRKAMPCAPGEWIGCRAGLENLPQQWIQLGVRCFAEISREKLLCSEGMACQVCYVQESGMLPPGWILRLSERQAGRYGVAQYTLEPLKAPWYRTQQPILLSRGDLLGINQGMPEGLSVFEAPQEKLENVAGGDIIGRLLKESGAMTLTALQTSLPHYHRRWLLRQLQCLMDQGHVLRQGQGRATVYQWQSLSQRVEE